MPAPGMTIAAATFRSVLSLAFTLNCTSSSVLVQLFFLCGCERRLTQLLRGSVECSPHRLACFRRLHPFQHRIVLLTQRFAKRRRVQWSHVVLWHFFRYQPECSRLPHQNYVFVPPG